MEALSCYLYFERPSPRDGEVAELLLLLSRIISFHHLLSTETTALSSILLEIIDEVMMENDGTICIQGGVLLFDCNLFTRLSL